MKASTAVLSGEAHPPLAGPGTSVERIAGRSPVVLTLVAKAGEALTLVALATIVPRVLGPSDYGVFAVALAAVGIVSLSLSLGGPMLLSRFVPAAPHEQRRALALALALRIARLRAILVATAVAVIAVLAFVSPARFTSSAAVFVGLGLLLDVAATLTYQLALALGRPILWSFRFPLQNTLLVVSVLALHESVGGTGALAAVAIASGGALAFGLPAVLRELREVHTLPPLPPRALRFGILQGVGGFFAQIALRGNVLLVLLLTSDRAEAGFAALATSLALAVTFAVWQMFIVELPQLSARADSDPAGVEESARRLARGATFVLAPVALAGVLIAEPLLPHLLGSDFGGVEAALVPALATLPLAGVTALAAQVAALRLRADIRVRTTGIGAAVLLGVAFIAIPPWGAVGGTSAFLAGAVATVIASARELPGVFGRSLLALALGAAAGVVVAGAVA